MKSKLIKSEDLSKIFIVFWTSIIASIIFSSFGSDVKKKIPNHFGKKITKEDAMVLISMQHEIKTNGIHVPALRVGSGIR
jgi:hypothetical protein|tara:strand:- start:200 stop:439 length:240 start_codon:yes stop_codon:yes gene_type:complete